MMNALRATVMRGHRRHLVALAIFAALTLLMTYPLALQAAHSIGNYGDPLLNAWALASNAHKFVTHPLDLFNANIFYPYPATLAYSENLIGISVLTAPLLWATDNPVLVHNLALLFSFPLCAFGAYLLVLDLTRSWYGGMVAGIAYGFAHFRFGELSQLQNLTIQWLPFALLYFSRFFRTQSWQDVLLAAFFLVIEALSSLYYGIYSGLAVALFVLFTFVTWRQPGNRIREAKTWIRLLAASALVLLVMVLVAIPYNTARAAVGERTLNDQFGATLQQYIQVSAQSLLGRLIPAAGRDLGATYFPGLVVVALVIFFLVSLVRRRRSGKALQVGRGDWRFYLVLAIVAFVLSLGTALRLTIDQPPIFQPLPYTILYNWAPGFKALRTPARIGPLVILSMAVLAGYGAALLRRRAKNILLLGLTALLAVEFVAVPARLLPIETGPQVPAVYHWLNNLPPDSVVLELPAVTSRSFWNDADSMPRLGRQQYFTTYHWHPTIMGYSGFWPPLFWTDIDPLLAFPSTASLDYLRGRGVSALVLHQDQFEPAAWEEMQQRLGLFNDQLTLLQIVDDAYVYALQPLQDQAADLQISVYTPSTAPAGKPYPVYLQVDTPNDAVAVHQTQQPYTISYRWQATETSAPNDDSSVVTTVDGVLHGDLPLVHPAGRSYIPVFLPAPPAPDAMLELEIDTLGQHSATTATVQESPEAASPPPGSETAPFFEAGFNYGDKLRLSHVALDATSYRAGDAIAVTLNWQRLAEDVSDTYVVFFRVSDAGGQEVFNDDRLPVAWPGPPATWPIGETVVDQHLLQLPVDLTAGTYTLALGLYDATTQQFVPLVDDDGNQRYAAFETTVEIQ
ncbi:MAG: hypothetical protein KDI03_07225 [Anaerolineae bacterium]|nr:hypothetical protein [Anaerolineae bacterium]